MIKRFFLSVILYLLMVGMAFAGAILNNPMFSALDSNGDPLTGGLLYSYIEGTVTAKSLYTDKACTVADTNPVVLDSRGEAEIYGTVGGYKLVLKTAADVTIWTIDNIEITSVNDTYYYFPDSAQADQGAASGGGSSTVKDFVDSIGSSKKATIVLVHTGVANTTSYIFLTSETITSNINIEAQNGALLAPASGITVTIYSPENMTAGDRQQIKTGDGSIIFSQGGMVSSHWWGVNGSASSTINADGINAAFNSLATNDLTGKILLYGDTTPYATDATIEHDSEGITFEGIDTGSHDGLRTSIKPDNGVTTAYRVYKSGGLEGFAVKGIQIDMDSMAAGSIGFDIAGAWRGSADDILVTNLNNNTTIGWQIRGVTGETGCYHNSYRNVQVFDGGNNGIALNMLGIAAGTKRVNQQLFLNCRFLNAYDGIIMEQCGGGNQFLTTAIENMANNGVTITNQSIGAAPIFIGGEIATITGTAVDGIATLINVPMASNGTDLANGAVRQQQSNDSDGRVHFEGGLNADGFFSAAKSQEITAASDTIDNLYSLLKINNEAADGNYDFTSNPQIEAGNNGQLIRIYGSDNSDFPNLINENGVNMNGPQRLPLRGGDFIDFIYFGAVGITELNSQWNELSRNHRNDIKHGFGIYDFALDAGAQGDITVGRLPDNATITKAWYEVITPFTSGAAATVAWGVGTDDATGLLTATAFDNAAYNAGYHDFTPDGTATNFTTKTASTRTVVMTIADFDLTAGKVYIWFEYIESE